MIKTKPKETQFEEIAKQSGVSKSAPDKDDLPSKSKQAPVPVSRKLEQDAAKKVLQEGVTGEDHGADEAKAKLPHINVPRAGK